MANEAEHKKKVKYSNLGDQYLFVPLAVETSGSFGSAAMSFIKELGRRIRDNTGDVLFLFNAEIVYRDTKRQCFCCAGDLFIIHLIILLLLYVVVVICCCYYMLLLLLLIIIIIIISLGVHFSKVVIVTVEGRNQTLFTLLLLKKKSSKGRKFHFKASVMTKVNFEKNVNKV